MALSGLLELLANVCFEGKNGHDSNWPLCRLMTHFGSHSAVRCWRSRESAGQSLIKRAIWMIE